MCDRTLHREASFAKSSLAMMMCALLLFYDSRQVYAENWMNSDGLSPLSANLSVAKEEWLGSDFGRQSFLNRTPFVNGPIPLFDDKIARWARQDLANWTDSTDPTEVGSALKNPLGRDESVPMFLASEGSERWVFDHQFVTPRITGSDSPALLPSPSRSVGQNARSAVAKPPKELQPLFADLRRTRQDFMPLDLQTSDAPLPPMSGPLVISDQLMGPGDSLWSARMSRRVGSVSIGERLMVTAATDDILNSISVPEQDLDGVHIFAPQDGFSVSRVGVQREILSERVTGYYTFEQSTLFADDEPWVDSSDFTPSAGENHRVGLQSQSSDGRWMISASGFYSESGREGAFFPSPTYQLNRGVELAIHAGVTPRWSTTMRLSEVASSVKARTDDGSVAPLSKQTNASLVLWNRFNLYRHENQSLTLGLGTRLVGQPRRSYQNSMILPGHSRWDVGLFYRRDGLDCRLYVENILDSRYYRDAGSLLSNSDSPLSIRAQVWLSY
jgi:hypothetical protein